MKEDRLPIHLHRTNPPAFTWSKRYEKRQLPVYLEAALSGLEKYQVYRYCSIPEALALFCRREWTFAHPTQWPDKYEQGVSRALFEGNAPFAYASAHAKSMSLEFSSNALWKTYAGSAGVLRLGIRLSTLADMLGNAECDSGIKIYVVRARYVDERHFSGLIAQQRSITLAKNVARYAVPALSLKRAGFSYENELRICAISERQGDPPSHLMIRNLDVSRFTTIQIDPYLSSWQASEIAALFHEQLKVGAKVSQSTFDSNVSFDADLLTSA